MKVYVVRASSDTDYENRDSWTCGVFASPTAAKEYIREQPEKFVEDFTRILELERLSSVRELTDDENEEYRERNNHWYWNRKLPIYYTETFELQGIEP